jgi:DNA mismatch repair protein MutS
VAEYLHDTPGLGARTLFATHYHELADLSRTREGVRNAHFEAREYQDDVIFLRQLVPGQASRSYGIQVAKLAGLPEAVIGRAREILHQLESDDLATPRLQAPAEGGEPGAPDPQLALFGAARSPDEEAALEALRGLDPERTTPLDALALLSRLSRSLHGGGDSS